MRDNQLAFTIPASEWLTANGSHGNPYAKAARIRALRHRAKIHTLTALKKGTLPHYTGQGRPVATLQIATNPRIKNQQTGEWDDGEPMYFHATAWGNLAENATETFTKGSPIIATGRLTFHEYTTKNGQTSHSHDIQLDQLGLNTRYALNNKQPQQTSYGTYTAPAGGHNNDPWATQKGTNNEQAPF